MRRKSRYFQEQGGRSSWKGKTSCGFELPNNIQRRSEIGAQLKLHQEPHTIMDLPVANPLSSSLYIFIASNQRSILTAPREKPWTYDVNHKDRIHPSSLHQKRLNRNILAIMATINQTQKIFIGINERLTRYTLKRIRVLRRDQLNVWLKESLVERGKDWPNRGTCKSRRLSREIDK